MVSVARRLEEKIEDLSSNAHVVRTTKDRSFHVDVLFKLPTSIITVTLSTHLPLSDQSSPKTSLFGFCSAFESCL